MKRREVVLIRIPELSVEAIGHWERHCSTLLQISLQMQGLKAVGRTEFRIRHGHDAIVEASCDAIPALSLVAADG